MTRVASKDTVVARYLALFVSPLPVPTTYYREPLSGMNLVVFDYSTRRSSLELFVPPMQQVPMELDINRLLPLPAEKVLCSKGMTLYWKV